MNDMKTWLLAALLVLGASTAAAQYDDDLYAPRKAAPAKQPKRSNVSAAPSNQTTAPYSASGSEAENKELITSYSEALQRRISAMRNASYEQPESYWRLLEQYQAMLERKYDQNLYNIVVVGDQMWVEPQAITAQFDGSDPAAGVIRYNEDIRQNKDKKQTQKQTVSSSGQVNINLNVDPWSMSVWPSVSYTTAVAPNVSISFGWGGGWGWPYTGSWGYGYYRPYPYYGYYSPWYNPWYDPWYRPWPYYGGYGPYYPYYPVYRSNPHGTYYGNSHYGNGRYGGGGGYIQNMGGGRGSDRPNGSNTVYGISGGRTDRPSGVAGGLTTSRPSGRDMWTGSSTDRPSGVYDRNAVERSNRPNSERTDRPAARPEIERPAYQPQQRPTYDRPSSPPPTFGRPGGGGGVGRPTGGGGMGGGRPSGR